MRRTITILSLLFLCGKALASDESLYCDFTHEKSIADSLQLRTPALTAGLGRNPYTLTNVQTLGVTESLSHYLKGRLQKDLGDGDCRLFHAMNEVTKHVTYDGPILSNHLLQAKIDNMRQAILRLDDLAKDENRRMKLGTSTVFLVDLINTAQAKIQSELYQLQMQVSPTSVPELEAIPLSQLLRDAMREFSDQQHRTEKSNKFDNWDLSVTAGGSQIGPLSSMALKPYATLSFSYSLGSVPRNHALSRSTQAFIQYTEEGDQGPLKLVHFLQQRVKDMLDASRASLSASQQYATTINHNLNSMAHFNNVNAHKFIIQLTIDRIVNDVDRESARNAVDILEKYLNTNFQD